MCVCEGVSREELVLELGRRKGMETDPHSGKMFAYVYTRGGAKFDAVETAFDMFQFENSESEGEEEVNEKDKERGRV